MAAEWKESFDKTRYSNQWEHIYAAGWKAAKAAEALKPSHNTQSAAITQIAAEMETYAAGSMLAKYSTSQHAIETWARQLRAL